MGRHIHDPKAALRSLNFRNRTATRLSVFVMLDLPPHLIDAEHPARIGLQPVVAAAPSLRSQLSRALSHACKARNPPRITSFSLALLARLGATPDRRHCERERVATRTTS